MFAAAWGHCSSTVGLDRLFPMVMKISDDQPSAPSYPLRRVAVAQSCIVQAFLVIVCVGSCPGVQKQKQKQNRERFLSVYKSTCFFVICVFIIVIVRKPCLTV
jgi:hypothetical protein